MKKLILASAALIALAAWAKKPLDHDCFDGWLTPRIQSLSPSGAWAAYTVNPQEGDGVLTLREMKSGREINIPRGAQPRFTSDSRHAVLLIKPHFADTRQAKIDKKKDLDMPQDTLALVDLVTRKVEKIPNVTNYRLGQDGGDWVAFLTSDTTYITPKNLKDKKSGKPLVVRNLNTGAQKVLPWVKEYRFSRLGDRLAAFTKPAKSDSTAVSRMVVLSLPDTTEYTVLQEQQFFGTPTFSRDSRRMAFTASTDSTETGTRRSKLYVTEFNGAQPTTEERYVRPTVVSGGDYCIMPPHITPDMSKEQQDHLRQAYREHMKAMAGDSIFINQYTRPEFSYDGTRLIAGVARYIAPDDTTIVDFEQPKLDIWRWDAPYTPPKEESILSKTRSHTLPMVFDLVDPGKDVLITENELANVEKPYRWDGDWALVHDPSATIVSQQWDYAAPEELSIVNLKNGERRYVATTPVDASGISPEGKYIYWFADRQYYAYDIANGKTICLSEAVEFPLWDEMQDIPLTSQPYGVMGWTKGDNALLVYDRFDIWSLDPTGKNAPVNLTKGEGRKNHLRYKYIQTDPEEINLTPGQNLLLSIFDRETKENGLATMRLGAPATPKVNVLDKYQFNQVRKAKNADAYAFTKSNFTIKPDVYLTSNGDFSHATKVTDTDSQRREYNWGNAELVKWYTYNGKPAEGVLYTPEDLDPNKEYPMIVYFYETYTDDLYMHYTMEPSWSWINFPFYVSRGYCIFVPDIHYTPGIPGENAYDYICSGVQDLCKKRPYIDTKRIGIDGQSWGGYQTAFLVTRTNMFACAGSGAPVSNMTSAFGGIRWESGESRQAQYECGQSRIGRNLWEAPELYIANSPVFHADRVNTPLLIMANDADGAVPWYQGIEYFMALRRLGKPVWMLQYNGEAHNLKARKNRKDITHRLQEFFDYYLKDGGQGPMPRWMKEGIPMLRKGQELRYNSK